MFWKKKVEVKPMNSEEYEKLLKKIAEVQSDVTKQNSKYESLEAQYNLLRGQFNRKLSGIKKQDDADGNLDIRREILEPPKDDSEAKNLNITPGIIPMKW